MKTIKSLEFTVSVEVDEALREACRPFDYAFSGTSIFSPPPFVAPRRDGTWNLGLIVGPSGSGKTKLLEYHYGITSDPTWEKTKAIASQVPIEKLMAVGLNSVPTWCRPYHVLSNGEQFRARIAALLRTDVTFDEFTSVVDRTVAKASSHAVQRHIRTQGITGVVFAACHYDIIEWLRPDWVFDLATGVQSSGRDLRRPPIRLSITPCGLGTWGLFEKHHYLSGSLNKTARCFLAKWENKSIAFAAALPFPNGNFKRAWRGHRTVVLPDFQGLGIGVRLSDAVAQMFLDEGCRYFSKTAHPRMGQYRNASSLWRPTSKNGRARLDYSIGRKTKEDGHKMKHRGRVCFSHEYVGIDPK